ncbi:unnamed protein product [Vitrella brassicaformis CCMP3155]|uniref:Uncharacterized protein n=2 Tax=Vitrella brassicaformis TaxID=1169539 RepID=A0A0G4ERV3_VITBC|nr:unnamed protein product [Vitrella brassicaformis CCMP3155]|eukprot:CEM00627.1 unnamed protein product [Vitrella brassicaformis CCMP3155]
MQHSSGHSGECQCAKCVQLRVTIEALQTTISRAARSPDGDDGEADDGGLHTALDLLQTFQLRHSNAIAPDNKNAESAGTAGVRCFEDILCPPLRPPFCFPDSTRGLRQLSYDPSAFRPRDYHRFLLTGRLAPLTHTTQRDARGCRGGPPIEVTMAFLVGSGRSGTTFLAEVVSQLGCDEAAGYDGIFVLDEPRQLWLPAFPSMDVWSTEAPKRSGRLGGLSASPLSADAISQVRQGYRRVIRTLVDAQQSPRGGESPDARRVLMVEKFPEHGFSIDLLAKVFQQPHDSISSSQRDDRVSFAAPVRVIHVVRDGIEVARSIRQLCVAGGGASAWYGVKDLWKWRQLLTLIHGLGDLQQPQPSFWSLIRRDYRPASAMAAGASEWTASECGELFAMGLLEWALAIHAARNGTIDQGVSVSEVPYKNMITCPQAAMASVGGALGLSDHAVSSLARVCEAHTSAKSRQAYASGASVMLSDDERRVLSCCGGSLIGAYLVEASMCNPTHREEIERVCRVSQAGEEL